jgi:hypothetical protein
VTPPEILFKYVGSAQHHLDILRKRQIRFTQPDDLNDPHDCIPGVIPPKDVAAFVDGVIARSVPGGLLPSLSAQQQANARGALIARYEADVDALVERCFDIVRRNLNRVGVLSLTTSNENLVLWAHYADSHRGMVVGFRPGHAPLLKHPDEAKREGELLPVSYGPKRAVVAIDQIDLPVDVLFQKHDRWQYEDEWRMVRRLERCDVALKDGSGKDRFFLGEIDPVAVARVDVGEFASDETVSAVLEATAAGTPLAHVKVYRARMNAGRTAFQFKLLN